MLRFRKNSQTGFTLIELLVVVGIIALLATVVMSALNVARRNARDAQRVANLRVLHDALEAYYQDNGIYPKSNGGGGGWQGSACGKNYITGLNPNYITQLPKDPSCGTAICQGTTGKDFIYQSTTTGTGYKLLIDGCFETSTYTAAGKAYSDPVRSGLPAWGGIWSTLGSSF